MELSIQIAWVMIALIHFGPSLPLLQPSLIERLYGVPATGETGLLLVHRAVLFATILLGATWAVFDPSVRRLMALICGMSMIGFLVFYARAGAPKTSLRKIAIVDAVGLAPLAWVSFQAWT